jgi:hypothetical protein
MPDGTVAMLGPDAGPGTAPHFKELHTFPDYTSLGPYEPMPGWFRQLLVGPAHLFNTLRGELENLDDWGVMADAIRFRSQDDELSVLYAQQESIVAEIDSVRFARTLTQSRLESAQVHRKLEHLKGTVRGVSWRSGGQSPP